MADNTAKIAEIKEATESGVASSTVDGTSVTMRSHNDLSKIKRNLELNDDTLRSRRPVAASMDLSGLFR